MTEAIRSIGVGDFTPAAPGGALASSQEFPRAQRCVDDRHAYDSGYLRAWLKKLIDMEISRRAAIMNGKFESTSKNQDESNLNRPPCPLMKDKARLMPILRGASLSIP